MNPAPDDVDLFEHAPVGYMLLDVTGCIERINHAGASILGWDQAWLVGKPFSRWVANNDKQLFHAHQHRLRHCGRCSSQELRIKNRQGRATSLRLQSARQAGPSDDAAGCRTIMIDISGEQESARALRRLQSQLTHVTRLHTAGEFATSLAHELNQPLGTVVLNCEAAMRLLNSGADREYEFAEALTQAIEAASFASGVIRHLRGFLRKDGELHQVCRLSTLIHDVRILIETDARDHDIELRLDIERGMPDVRVDPVQIKQVLVNLARNSIDAMNECNRGGQNLLNVRASRPSASYITVSVEDTGPCLDAQQAGQMFMPFYTTKHDGMGMGLSISRTIIETHGGRLWAETGTAPDGSGVTMHFTLPTIEDQRHAD